MPILLYIVRKDAFSIQSYLGELQNQELMHVGISLGLAFTELNHVASDRILAVIANKWLKMDDCVTDTTGIPTLKNLVKALRDNGHTEVAVSIEERFQCRLLYS